MTVKTVPADLNLTNDNLNLQFKKSKDLTKEWQNILKN